MNMTICDVDTEIEIPAKYDVCDRCQGRGSIGHPAFDGHSPNDLFDDQEDFDNYLNGGYDVSCPDCKGKRVVLVADLDQMAPDEIACYERHLDSEAEFRHWQQHQNY